jgi:hypothetical protein
MSAYIPKPPIIKPFNDIHVSTEWQLKMGVAYAYLDFRIFKDVQLFPNFLVFFIWPCLVYPATLLKNFISAVSVLSSCFLFFYFYFYGHNFGSICKCRYRQSFIKLYLSIFACLAIQFSYYAAHLFTSVHFYF